MEMFPSVLVGSIHFDCAPYHTTLLTEHPNVVQLHFGGQPHPPHGCHLCAVLGEPPVRGPEPGCVLTPVAASSGVRDSYHSAEGALVPPPTARTGEFRLCAHLCNFPFLLASSHPIKKISSFRHLPRLGYGASSVKNAAFFLLSLHLHRLKAHSGDTGTHRKERRDYHPVSHGRGCHRVWGKLQL